jgi:hypothetical protein
LARDCQRSTVNADRSTVKADRAQTGLGQGWTWAGSGRPGPDTCRSLVQPCCGFGLILGLWFTRRGSPWTCTRGAWTEGQVRGGLSPPLLPLLVHSRPGAHGCSSPLLSLPPNSSILTGECPPAVNGRLGGYWSRVVHPLSFLRLGEGRAG